MMVTLRKSGLLIVLYVVVAAAIYFQYVQPALAGLIDLRLWADAKYYIDYDRLIGSSENLITLTGSAFGPVMMLRLLNYDNGLVLLANCLLFIVSCALIFQHFDVERSKFLILLFINPITLFSLTSINKEIWGLLSAVLVACYFRHRHFSFVILALGAAFMARWPQFLVTAVFFLVNSPLFPWRRNRLGLVLSVVLVISVVYPLLRDFLDPLYRSGETFLAPQNAQAFGVLEILNGIQERFGFFIAAWPKILINYVGNFPRIIDVVFRPDQFNQSDIYNTYVVLGHQICMMIILAWGIKRRIFTLDRMNVYFIVLYSLVMTVSPLINYRIYFPIYILFCVELTRKDYSINKSEARHYMEPALPHQPV